MWLLACKRYFLNYQLPVLFSIYLDELILKLEYTGVGCVWNSHHAGALAYADGIVLLASALCTLLATCESHGSCLGLQLNLLKTRLINFQLGVSDFNNFKSNHLNCPTMHSSIPTREYTLWSQVTCSCLHCILHVSSNKTFSR